jgi:hypothetical protein
LFLIAFLCLLYHLDATGDGDIYVPVRVKVEDIGEVQWLYVWAKVRDNQVTLVDSDPEGDSKATFELSVDTVISMKNFIITLHIDVGGFLGTPINSGCRVWFKAFHSPKSKIVGMQMLYLLYGMMSSFVQNLDRECHRIELESVTNRVALVKVDLVSRETKVRKACRRLVRLAYTDSTNYKRKAQYWMETLGIVHVLSNFKEKVEITSSWDPFKPDLELRAQYKTCQNHDSSINVHLDKTKKNYAQECLKFCRKHTGVKLD